MAGLRFADLQSRPTEFLDFTSLTLDEFQRLVPPFEAAFQAHMASWRLDGKPRTARQFAVSTNCPLPTPEDRLLFILAYIKTYSLQVVQGRLFSMGQRKANQWIHVLFGCAAGRAAHPRRCPRPLPHGPGPAARRHGGRRGHGGHATGGGTRTRGRRIERRTGVLPFAHDGTERRIVRPQDPPEQTDCYSGKKKGSVPITGES